MATKYDGISKRWRQHCQVLNATERNTVAIALRLAAETYGKDALANKGTPRLADQFADQESVCIAIAEALEP